MKFNLDTLYKDLSEAESEAEVIVLQNACLFAIAERMNYLIEILDKPEISDNTNCNTRMETFVCNKCDVRWECGITSWPDFAVTFHKSNGLAHYETAAGTQHHFKDIIHES